MERIGSFMVSHPWIVTFPLAALAALAVGVGAYNFIQVRDQGERVTRIERSPCQLPASPECFAVTRAVARLEPLSNACISFRRVIRPRSVYRQFTRCGDYRRAHDLPTDKEEQRNDGTTGTTTSPRSTGGPVPDSPSGTDGGSGGTSDIQPEPVDPPPSDPPSTPPDPPAPPSPPSPPAPPSPPSSPTLGDAIDEVTGIGCQITSPLGICIK